VAQPFRIFTGFPEHLAAIKMNSRSPFSKSTPSLEEFSAAAKIFVHLLKISWAKPKRFFVIEGGVPHAALAKCQQLLAIGPGLLVRQGPGASLL
jgi:hypothetical protein